MSALFKEFVELRDKTREELSKGFFDVVQHQHHKGISRMVTVHLDGLEFMFIMDDRNKTAFQVNGDITLMLSHPERHAMYNFIKNKI